MAQVESLRRVRRASRSRSISDAAFKVRFLRRSRELYRRYLEGKNWIGQMYSQVLGLRPGMTILDVGCGTGDFTRFVAQLAHKDSQLIGVDSRPVSVKAATRETRKLKLSDRVEFRTGDVNHLPFEDNYADLTCCRTLLMHLPDPLVAVKEMSRVTKPRGTVAAVEPGGMRTFHDPRDQSFTELAAEVEKAYRRGIRKLEGKSFDIGERLPGIFQKAGLVDVRADIQADAWVYSDPRKKIRDLKDEMRFEWQMFKDNEKTETNYILAGGLSKAKTTKFIREQERRVKERLSNDTLLRNDMSIYGSSLFIIAGTKTS